MCKAATSAKITDWKKGHLIVYLVFLILSNLPASNKNCKLKKNSSSERKMMSTYFW